MEISHDRLRAWKYLFLIILMGVFSFAALAWAANQIKAFRFVGSNPTLTRSISVAGEGKVYVRADLAMVQLTVSSDAGQGDLGAVQERNANKANAVTEYAKSRGVKEEDIKTVNYSITPRYNYSQYGQEFLGYNVRQDIQLKIRDLSKVGEILKGAVSSGANEVSQLQFTVDDPKSPEEEARMKAITDAKAKAEKLAEALGVRLVRVTNFSESGGGVPPPVYYREAVALGKGGGGVPDIQIGQNEVQLYVILTYEIE
ncbi:MAG: SIMPL domain-containing protein [Candidatus Sungbacteria bacterium]|nr:SIMPL domain-containing protein [Candidatus Sungbacteria bacterium]